MTDRRITRKRFVLLDEAVQSPIALHRSVPLCFSRKRAPTSADYDYEIFSVWRDSSNFKLYILSNRDDTIAVWNNLIEQNPDAKYVIEFLDQAAELQSTETVDNKMIFTDDRNIFFNKGATNQLRIGTTADRSAIRINDIDEIVHGVKDYLNYIPIPPFSITRIGESDYTFDYTLPLNVLKTISCDISAIETSNHNVNIFGTNGLETEGVLQDTMEIKPDSSHVLPLTFNESISYSQDDAILLNNILYVAKNSIASGLPFNASEWRNLNQSAQTLSAEDDQTVPIDADGNIKILGTEKIGNNLSVIATNVKVFDDFGTELIPSANTVFIKTSLTLEDTGLDITMVGDVQLIRPRFNIRQTSILVFDVFNAPKFEIFSDVDQKHSIKEGSGISLTNDSGFLRIDSTAGGGMGRVWKDESGVEVLTDGADTSFIFGNSSKGITVNAISDRFQIDVDENIRRVTVQLIDAISFPKATVPYNEEQVLGLKDSDSILFDTTFSPNEITATTPALLKFDIPNNAVFTQNNAMGLSSNQGTISITSTETGIINLEGVSSIASATTLGFDINGFQKFSQPFVDGNLLLMDSESGTFQLNGNRVTVETTGSGGGVDLEVVSTKNGILEPLVVGLNTNGRLVEIEAFTAIIKGVKTEIGSGSISVNDTFPTVNLKQFYLTYNPDISNFEWSNADIDFVLTERILMAIYFISSTEVILLNQSSSIHNNMNETYAELSSGLPYIVSDALLTFDGNYKVSLSYKHLYLTSAQGLELEVPVLNRVVYNNITKEFSPFTGIIGSDFTVSLVMFSILEADIYEVFFINTSLENPSVALAVGLDIFRKEKLQIFNCFIAVHWILYHGIEAVQFVGVNDDGIALLKDSITCDENVTYLH